MEKFLSNYLRILDIDPYGYSIRLINNSHDQSLDLSNILIRQYHHDDLILISYKFQEQIRPLLRSGEVVSIYSKGSDQYQFNIEPYIFIGETIRNWLTDIDIQTDLSLNQIILHSSKFHSFSSTDVPSLFLNRSIDLKQFPTKLSSYSNRYARFIYPYCLSNNDIVNPHTSAIMNEKIFYEKNHLVKHFDSYPRRLTTASQRIRSVNIT
jgi:hypothetical protein